MLNRAGAVLAGQGWRVMCRHTAPGDPCYLVASPAACGDPRYIASERGIGYRLIRRAA